MRFFLLALLVALVVPGVSSARPKKRVAPKAQKVPAGEIRGAVKEDKTRKPIAAEVEGDTKKKMSKDPRLEGSGKEGATGGVGSPALQRGSRLEFDGRLVQGQTARSGAVYLFERARSELKSMVRERQSYREEIVRTVFPDGLREGRER